ncbi:nucleoside monophosphate kinase [Patescibacteria group bacterium]|nr:nucleoside monophosphate kinase [Patescibacteria group bacterium]MBU1703525.1 nucleoside monophosphate kinase [Patescibacteria group bacterium]MBU1953432.1 nucleoside monophosphate kinase [Patescibacteria group bacterium]
MDIVLFGIQGSGKGTIARAVSEKFGFHYFETGAELRKLSQENSPLGHKVKEIIEAGKLVPNDIVMEIIEHFMETVPANESAIFDGIPRKQFQAETFDALMKKLGRSYIGILVHVPEDIALKRLTLRRICESCKAVYPADYDRSSCEKCSGELVTRSDDNPESIKTRFAAYFEETMPVIEGYKARNMLLTIDGIPRIPEVRDATFRLIEEKLLK